MSTDIPVITDASKCEYILFRYEIPMPHMWGYDLYENSNAYKYCA